MGRAKVKVYVSPTCVLLALDWPQGRLRQDFLGFAIRRTPGFSGEQRSWLPNIIGFQGPLSKDDDPGSNKNPIQKFLWWDARIDDDDRGKKFSYEVIPVLGSPGGMQLLDSNCSSTSTTIPHPVKGRIGTYFNRAVVSSQAFSRTFGEKPTGDTLSRALKWLANGMEDVIPEFVRSGKDIHGAIYHLTDDEWVIPSLKAFTGKLSIVFNRTSKDHQSDDAASAIRVQGRKEFLPRTRAAIMHNKFLVGLHNGKAASLLMGSANFTTGGLTTQANLMHTFASPALAREYLGRKRLIERDPTVGVTAQKSGWSQSIKVDDATVRVIFSPEPKDQRESIETIVKAIGRAKRSVLFCLFMPTDAPLRRACFEAGDKGKMMLGLVNTITERENGSTEDASSEAKIEIYHRSRGKRDVFAHSMYAGDSRPQGFWWEKAQLPGGGGKWPVFIHHKLVVIDAETSSPTIYTGSANMSKNALWRNDENLLEIKGSTHLAGIYLTEFMRLYEHYRARATWNRHMEGKYKSYKLQGDSRWARKHFTAGTPEYKSRISMVGG